MSLAFSNCFVCLSMSIYVLISICFFVCFFLKTFYLFSFISFLLCFYLCVLTTFDVCRKILFFTKVCPNLGNKYESAQKQQLPSHPSKAPSGQYSIVQKKCHPLFLKIQNPAPQIFKKIVQTIP